MAVKDSQLQKREKNSVGKVDSTHSSKIFVPLVDIFEDEGSLILNVDMPGTSESSIDITIEQGVLHISGKYNPPDLEDYNLAYSEYEIGDYQRSFTLMDTIDQEKIEANYKNGTLVLKLPKIEPAKPKKIKVISN